MLAVVTEGWMTDELYPRQVQIENMKNVVYGQPLSVVTATYKDMPNDPPISLLFFLLAELTVLCSCINRTGTSINYILHVFHSMGYGSPKGRETGSLRNSLQQ